MHTAKQQLGHPVFLLSVLLLLLNDWFLKPVFHNELTGKLSDFAGLFAFPFFLSVLLPAQKKTVHILTALLFVWWKSDWSQPFIDALNNCYIPVGRVVDYTDYIALISIAGSAFVLQNRRAYRLNKIAFNSILIISSFAFAADQMATEQYALNKEYTFDCSGKQLIAAFNTLQLHYAKRFKSSLSFDAEKNIFYFRDTKDTVAYLLDHTKVKDGDTLTYQTKFFKMIFTGNQQQSKLRLINVTLYSSPPPLPWYPSSKKAIKAFERKVVRKLRKYTRNKY
ncbi:hypothetical protein [Niabella drilacis]|uniref:Uncharacterized protein n=1 Tax=Niabella drilacis (strain DSM 25811 / CCM 8410 / CCUG 62505 / LMG 26954 / E90) TaxID=1285928 RepID=A0A1G6SLZ6_NIADE|nr:hypothetical protein [Niabella drilacis]SDD17237.1 hypothetical protein SAMN04487894_106260 [Niabella drilacis]